MLKLQIESCAADGRLWLIINGTRYYYELDAAYLEQVDRLIRLQKCGKALALVKRVQTFYRRGG